MALTVKRHHIYNVRFGTAEGLSDGVLTVDPEKLTALLTEDPLIRSVHLDVAAPGEKTRIIHILDAITPICSSDGANCFPGFLGTPETCGRGTVCELRGVYLLTCGTFPSEDAILRTREAVVDMWGEGSRYSPFASSMNLVLTLDTDTEAEKRNTDAAVRLAGLKAAEYLARIAEECEPDETEEIGALTPAPELPGVCAMLQLASIGTLFDTFLYGRTVDGILPTLISRQELLAGAVVTDEYFYGGQRQPTCMYQHNPIVEELLRRHGETVNFKGIILCRGYNNTNIDKRRAAGYCANLAEMLGATGVILHPESGGNSHVDCMLTAQECEKIGISTVILAAEMGDVESRDVSLIDYVPEATAIVSAGNREALVAIEKAERVLGGVSFLESTLGADEEQKIPLNFYFCATSQIGAWNISMDAM